MNTANAIDEDDRLGGASSPVRRVLLAEDDPEMRLLLAAYLARFGFSVSHAASGDELWARLADAEDGRRPDVVVTDVHMPGLSGLDVLARLREIDPDTPVIVITSFGDRRTHRRARELGAARVFDKPFDLDELVDEVESILAS